MYHDSFKVRNPMYPEKPKKEKKSNPEHTQLTETDHKAHAIENYLDHGRKNSSTLAIANMLEGGNCLEIFLLAS